MATCERKNAPTIVPRYALELDADEARALAELLRDTPIPKNLGRIVALGGILNALTNAGVR